MLKLGPLVIDRVPVQSAATVYVPTPPVASIIIKPPMFTVPNGLNVVPSPLNRRPCIMAFGTRFPPTFWYPSQVHTYTPFSMPTLQTCASAAARAVADVPGPSAIAAAKHTNPQEKARQLTIIFVNFVFIVIVSFCLSFFLFWPSLASRYC